MKDMILQFVDQMTHEEKLELQMALERAIAEEMVPEAAGEADSANPSTSDLYQSLRLWYAPRGNSGDPCLPSGNAPSTWNFLSVPNMTR